MTKPPPLRRTHAERTRTSRDKILRAATELFARQGYRNATMADIANSAQMTVPGLLHHYPSKTHLLMAVLSERDRVDQGRFDFTRPEAKDEPLASLSQSVAHNQMIPGIVRLFAILVSESLQEEHPGHDHFAKRYHAVRERTTEVFRHAQAQGEVRADLAPEDLSVMIFAMMDGLQIQWLYEPESIDMSRLFGQFARLLRPTP